MHSAARLTCNQVACGGEIIRNELDLAMAFCGLRDVRQVDRNLLLPGTY